MTVPNVVTLVRLACIPLYVWLLFGADRQTGPQRSSAALGATDWVDGYVARRFHQVSTVGKVLDPVADRVLVLTAVITIMVQGAVPVWFGVATLAREVVVSAAVLLLASLGAARIDVLWVGKAGHLRADDRLPALPGERRSGRVAAGAPRGRLGHRAAGSDPGLDRRRPPTCRWPVRRWRPDATTSPTPDGDGTSDETDKMRMTR